MEIVLSLCEYSRTDIYSNRNLSDVKCADDVLLPKEDSSRLHVFLSRLNDVIREFWMHFAPVRR